MEPTAKFLFFILSQILMAFFLFRLLMEFPAFFFPSKFDLALMVSGIQGVKRDQHPIRITCFIISPDPKGHVRYFRHLSSITNFKHYLDRICKKKKFYWTKYVVMTEYILLTIYIDIFLLFQEILSDWTAKQEL